MEASRRAVRHRPGLVPVLATWAGALCMVLSVAVCAPAHAAQPTGDPGRQAEAMGPAPQRVVGAPVRVIRGIAYERAECPGRGRRSERADLYEPDRESTPGGRASGAEASVASASSASSSGALRTGEVRAGSPLVVLVHGGSFVKGSDEVDSFPRVATELASLGWSAASIDYCLPPRGIPGYPTEASDVRHAIGYFEDRARQYGIDPRRIAVWGASAGASLAIDSTTLIDRGSSRPIVAAVGWSGAYDLGATRGVGVPIAHIVDNYLGCAPLRAACRSTAQNASAIRHIRAGATPPMFLVNSTHELMPLAQLSSMRRALTAAHVRNRVLIVPGDRHAMSYTDEAFCPSVSFLERYLGPTTGECAVPEPVTISAAGFRRLDASLSRSDPAGSEAPPAAGQ